MQVDVEKDSADISRYSSPVETVLRRVPLAPHWTCGIIGALILVVYLALAVFGGEAELLAIIVNSVVNAFSISLLMYGEFWIGANIRRTLRDIRVVFGLDPSIEDVVLKRIHNNPRRMVVGVVVMVLLLLPPIYHIYEFSYLPLLIYNFLIAAFLRFLLGEMLPGIGSLIRSEKMLGKRLSDKIDVIDEKKLEALKDLAGWGLQISAFGGFVAIAVLVGLVYPFSGAVILPPIIFAGFVLVVMSIFIVGVFVLPTMDIHKMMRIAKLELKQEISERYSFLYEEMKNLPRNDSLFKEQNRIKTISDLLHVIDKMEVKANEAPEWPFEVRQVQKVIGTVLVPIIIFLLQNISELLSFVGIG
ncbi:MAG: hypothetical protein ACW987_09255 [Candidatus Thorarchaeota archaeon]